MLVTRVIYFIFVLFKAVEGSAAKSSFVRDDKPKWKRLSCDNIMECPRIMRRQQKGFSEVCFLGDRDWFKFTWEVYREDDKPAARSDFSALLRKVINRFKLYFKELVIKNGHNLVKKSSMQTFLARGFHQHKTAQLELYLLVPKVSKGSLVIPCNDEMKKLLKKPNCEQFTYVYKSPKCFYAIEQGHTKEALTQLRDKLGVPHDEELKVGIMPDKLSDFIVTEWHQASDDLYTGEDDTQADK